MTYCFFCSEENPLKDPDTDQCLICGSVVEEVEWDEEDSVWVPVPPLEDD